MKAKMIVLLLFAACCLPGGASAESQHMDDRPCLSRDNKPGVMKSGLCIDGSPRPAAPVKMGCIYGQAGCVMNRRQVEEILKQRETGEKAAQ